jgi:hypothetical protein
MSCHKVFKKVFGKNQKLDLFIWGMRAIVVVLNIMPFYTMNYVSSTINDNKNKE